MAVLTYKCPNCDGGLVFDPTLQQYKCNYCLSSFTQPELDDLSPAAGEETHEAHEHVHGQETSAEHEEIHANLYSCPSCGAEVLTDETTAATFCYYCHNPVVLSGRLDGNFAPDWIIPFSIDKNRAVEDFLKWTGKKKFIPRAFFSKKQIDTITGIYFPYWMVNCDVYGAMNAHATRVRSWRTGNTEHTETDHFQVVREGNLRFAELTMNALKKANPKLSEGVQPFDFGGLTAFSMPYLSGFQAEKRDIESGQLEEFLDGEIREYTTSLFRETAVGYATVTPEFVSAVRQNTDWKYLLLPVWIVTYKDKKKKQYFYAMNGQTGKIVGELPVDYGRLAALFALISVPLFAILTLGGYLL